MQFDKEDPDQPDQHPVYSSDDDQKFLLDEGLDLLANFRKLSPDLRKRVAELLAAMQSK